MAYSFRVFRAISRFSWSKAPLHYGKFNVRLVYYGVECNDYAYPGDTPAAVAEAYLRAGDAVEAGLPRFSSIFYMDMPCAFWPHGPTSAARPAPLAAKGIPTLVLGATADPATPVNNGQRVYSRLDDGYLVTTQGGAHIIFGRGNACPDDLVTAFLVEDKMPDQREAICEGVVVNEYVSIAPASAADFANPLQALSAVDDEINYLPEYYYWDLETPTSVGCPYGGTLSFEATDAGNSFTLAGCAFSTGFTMTGDGSYNSTDDVFTLEVAVTGLTDGKLTYTRQSDGVTHVTGQYDGQPVDLSE